MEIRLADSEPRIREGRLMPLLTVGNTQIPYLIRYSNRARKLSIKVTPSLVEAVAPVGFPEKKLVEFVHDKRKWVYQKVEELTSKEGKRRFTWPEKFVTGAKIPFRGRNMKLSVLETDIPRVQITYRNAFIVEKPGDATEADVKRAIEKWLHNRLVDDVIDLIREYTPRIGATPGRIRVSKVKTRWGSCGKHGNILINWLLVIAPKPVLEYVVVHELCHLKHRNHSEAFWSLVGELLPDYRRSKKWLAEHGRFMHL